MADTDSESRRFVFTKTKVESLSFPASGREVYHDAKTTGLILRVTSAGQRSFYFYRKVRGRPVRYLLGVFPTMSVEAARKAFQGVAGKVAQGHDPQAERRAARHEHTVGGLFAHWLDHAQQHKRTWREDQRQFNVFLKAWAGRWLSSIHKADVQALHVKVGKEHGRYAANRLLALVRAMFNKASDIGFTGDNPAVRITKFKEKSRDRFLHGDELPRFFGSLVAETDIFRDFFLIGLLTGARRANVQAMRWDDIDLQPGLWRIPGESAKGGEPIIVPLSPPAIAILRQRQLTSNGNEWVFASHGKTGHLVEPKSAWKRILDRAGLADLRIHDLRRSLGSWMATGGTSLPIIGKALGHKQLATTMIYSRLQVDPVKASVTEAGNNMLEAGRLVITTQDEKGGDENTI